MALFSGKCPACSSKISKFKGLSFTPDIHCHECKTPIKLILPKIPMAILRILTAILFAAYIYFKFFFEKENNIGQDLLTLFLFLFTLPFCVTFSEIHLLDGTEKKIWFVKLLEKPVHRILVLISSMILGALFFFLTK